MLRRGTACHSMVMCAIWYCLNGMTRNGVVFETMFVCAIFVQAFCQIRFTQYIRPDVHHYSQLHVYGKSLKVIFDQRTFVFCNGQVLDKILLSMKCILI